MKILEAQSAVLTNHEVYQHLVDQSQRYQRSKRRGPPNLGTVVNELLVYMRTQPNPLSQEPTPYSPDCIAQLLQKLRPYDLAKGEVIMVLNHRPADVSALSTLVEDLGERFTADQQQEMVDIIAQVLGRFHDADDTTMTQTPPTST